MVRMKLFTAVAACFILFPAIANANAVYTFISTDPVFASSFSFTVPSIITGGGLTSITSFTSESDTGSFFTSKGCGPIANVWVADPSAEGTLNPLIYLLVPSCGQVVGIFGPPHGFDTFGTYTQGDSTLTISNSSPPPTSTPEPSSLVLLGTGLLGLSPLLWRHFA